MAMQGVVGTATGFSANGEPMFKVFAEIRVEKDSQKIR
jgi:hypothetical protein